MECNTRRFTLFDAAVFIAVIASAMLPVVAGLPKVTADASQISFALITNSRYIRDVLLGRPPASRLDSTRLLMSWSMTEVVGGRSNLGRGLPPRGQALVILEETVVLVFPLMVYGSFAQLLLRLRQLRPAWPAVVNQAGFSACISAMAALLCVTLAELAFGWRVPIYVVSAAVGLVWICLMIAGRLNAEKSWIDRVGRVIGGCWLVIGIIGVC